MDAHHKKCGACEQILERSFFHRRTASVDGCSARCKRCQQKYDAMRLHKPDRVAFRIAYRMSEHGKKLTAEGGRAWISRNPEKRAATNAIGNALRDGKVTRLPCSQCGEASNVQAHHEDYSKPLEVNWLCVPCHSTLHRIKRWKEKGFEVP